MSATEDDKRGTDRLTINKEFESFDAFIQEYVTNISRTGVFIKSTSPLEVGTQVNLRFTVIMEDIETIEGIGEVVRVEKDPRRFLLTDLGSSNGTFVQVRSEIALESGDQFRIGQQLFRIDIA